MSVSLPDSLVEIGNHAFHFCAGLTSLTLPAGLTKIGHMVCMLGIATREAPPWQPCSRLLTEGRTYESRPDRPSRAATPSRPSPSPLV